MRSPVIDRYPIDAVGRAVLDEEGLQGSSFEHMYVCRSGRHCEKPLSRTEEAGFRAETHGVGIESQQFMRLLISSLFDTDRPYRVKAAGIYRVVGFGSLPDTSVRPETERHVGRSRNQNKKREGGSI